MKRVLPLIFCILLAACAPQNRQQATSTPAAPPSPDQRMADFLGTALTGTSATFTGTSLGGGSVTVTAKDVYVSALGDICREGIATTSRGFTRIASCRSDETAPWQLAPAIFGKEAL